MALDKLATELSLNNDWLSVLKQAAEQAGKSRDAQTFEKLRQDAEVARQQMARAGKEEGAG